MHDEICRNFSEGIWICTQLYLMFSVSFCMQEQRTGVLETETGESPHCIERKEKVCSVFEGRKDESQHRRDKET